MKKVDFMNLDLHGDSDALDMDMSVHLLGYKSTPKSWYRTSRVSHCFAFFVWRLFVTLYVFTCMYLGRTTFFSHSSMRKVSRELKVLNTVFLLFFIYASLFVTLHVVVFPFPFLLVS